MANDVGVNGQSIVTKKSGGKLATGPDVCKTPSPGGPIPIPYPNFAQSSDLDKGSKSVKINGVPACLNTSNFSKSTGDEAGTLKGVASNSTKGKAEPINYSFDVRIEGKHVVRNLDLFVSNNKNTPPAPVMQAPVLLSIPGQDKEEKEKLYSCDWKDCEGKHTSEITYDNRGNVKRGSYTGTWRAPWQSGAGKTSDKITPKNYEAETGKATSLVEAKALFGTKNYVTNNHHLIPVAAMGKFSKLGHNAKLVGFDINDGKYGICLPYFITDIFRHDLQSHKTNHPNYSRKVEAELRDLEKQTIKFCTQDKQKQVVSELKDLADDLREFIEEWDTAWLLRKSATKDRQTSFEQAGLPHPK